MKKITVNDYQGNEISGDWNEKTYSSKIADNLVRIYLNNKEYHVEKSLLENVGANIAEDEKKRRLEKLDEQISTMRTEDKIYMMQKLFYSYDVQETLIDIDARAKGQIHQAFCKLFEN